MQWAHLTRSISHSIQRTWSDNRDVVRALEYIYARIFFFTKKTPYHDVSQYVALLWLSALVSLNVVCAIGLLGLNPMRIMNVKVYALIIFIIISFILYLMVFKNKKYKLIINRYSNESRKDRNIGYIILALYVIMTHIMIYYVSPNYD